MKTILFVCSGNTCRSPMAEAVAREHLREHVPDEASDVFVASAGVAALDGASIASETVEALQSCGIEFDSRSKRLTAEMVRKADAVFCMTDSHVQQVRALLGSDSTVDTRIERLDPQRDIDDPIGMGQEAYDRVLEHLRTIIPQRLAEVLNHEDRNRVGSSR